MRNWLSPTMRLSLGLAVLTATILSIAQALGLLADPAVIVLRERTRLCESMAIQVSWLASRNDHLGIETCLRAIAKRNNDIRAIGVRRGQNLIVEIGNHRKLWSAEMSADSAGRQIMVPIFAGHQRWGSVELCFAAPGGGFLWTGASRQMATNLAALMSICALVHFLYLRRMLAYLDPAAAVPDRVRTTLDTLAEGLLVLDKHERIVLANRAFSSIFGADAQQLIGKSVMEIPWTRSLDHTDAHGVLPWQQALRDGRPQTGAVLHLADDEGGQRTFTVNSAPILSETGVAHGTLCSFDDITSLEAKKSELVRALDLLQQSSEEIRTQNRELERLATHDPLTSCLNRRSLFERFEVHWRSSQRHNTPLSCIMVDVDHFKSINDNYGHSTGDQVLQRVGETLRQAARAEDLVARYGGEEFCVVLPLIGLEQAEQAAERFRLALAELQFDTFRITASFGVSEIALGAPDCQGLIDQADKCLYAAKRAGRNCVVRFDRISADLEIDEKNIARTGPLPTVDKEIATAAKPESLLSSSAVAALVAALTDRDPLTALHNCQTAGQLAPDLVASLMRAYRDHHPTAAKRRGEQPPHSALTAGRQLDPQQIQQTANELLDLVRQSASRRASPIRREIEN